MTKNTYPTKRQEDALKDVLRFPRESLAKRAKRLGMTRVCVLQHLRALGAKGLAEPDEKGKWEATLAGRSWLRPVMGTRRSA